MTRLELKAKIEALQAEYDAMPDQELIVGALYQYGDTLPTKHIGIVGGAGESPEAWKFVEPFNRAANIDMIGKTFAPPDCKWYAVDGSTWILHWYKKEPRKFENCFIGHEEHGAVYIGPCDWKNSKGKVYELFESISDK
jgi:hypothetical protein